MIIMTKRSDKHFFQLQRHGSNNTKATKYTCPSCGCRHSFTRYVYFENGEAKEIDETCGMCDHQSGCGYHLPPREFYRLHPERRIDLHSQDGVDRHKPVYTPPEREIDYIEDSRMAQFNGLGNNLVLFFNSLPLLDHDILYRVLSDYRIGSTYSKEIVYWQIDLRGRVRTGKIIPYDKENGHRIHGRYPVDWVHARMGRAYQRKRGEPAPHYHLQQCLFGEHLLSRRQDSPVCLVESEKTALLCAMIWPDYVWLATGGMNNMSTELLSVLEKRTVTVIPDTDAFNTWKENTFMFPACSISIFDQLEKRVTESDRAKKIDIGDIVVRYLTRGDTSCLDRLRAIKF